MTAEIELDGYACGTMYCAYCGERAVLRIPAMPDEVCRAHAIEFWTGLLAYSRGRSTDRDVPESFTATRPAVARIRLVAPATRVA